MRRTLALVGIAVLGFAGQSGPASADPGASITLDEGVVVNEVAASMGPSSDHNFVGGLIELTNVLEVGNVDISDWELTACNTTTTFDTLEITANTVLAPGEKYLIADNNFGGVMAPTPNQLFPDTSDILEQSAGGVELLNNDTTPVLQDELRWGEPDGTICDEFPDVGATPTDHRSINMGSTPWSHQIPTPERLN